MKIMTISNDFLECGAVKEHPILSLLKEPHGSKSIIFLILLLVVNWSRTFDLTL